MFFKEVSSAPKACIYLIQSRPTAKQYNFEIFSLFKITVFYLNILKNVIDCDFKAEFLASLLQSRSFRNHSDLLLKNIYYHYDVEKS